MLPIKSCVWFNLPQMMTIPIILKIDILAVNLNFNLSKPFNIQPYIDIFRRLVTQVDTKKMTSPSTDG